MSHVSVPYFPPCRMSNLRKPHVTCRYLIKTMLHVIKANVALSNLKIGHVTVSILGVNTHVQGLWTPKVGLIALKTWSEWSIRCQSDLRALNNT